jgi:PAS domain-containing protein
MHFAEYLDHLAESGAVLDAMGQADAWRALRRNQHHDSNGSYLEPLSDGRCLRISERATADGGRVAIYTDISEIKRQEQLLRQQDQAAQRQLLAATVNSLRQGIAVFDQHSQLLAWNHRFCELAGLHRPPCPLARPCRKMPKFRCSARSVAVTKRPATGWCWRSNPADAQCRLCDYLQRCHRAQA